MTLNFRSASYLSAGNSGSTALTVCAGGLLQLLSNPHSSQGQVSSQHGVLQARTSSKPFTEEAEGSSARTCWSLCSHSAGCWASSFPWQDLPCSTPASDQSGLSRTTGNCEPRQKSLRGHFSLKRNHFFLKEHQVKIGADLSRVLSTF